jgi:LysM repeat protein
VAAPTYVTVKKGDTLATIAQKRGVSIERLKSINRMRSNTIVAGQRLKLP